MGTFLLLAQGYGKGERWLCLTTVLYFTYITPLSKNNDQSFGMDSLSKKGELGKWSPFSLEASEKQRISFHGHKEGWRVPFQSFQCHNSFAFRKSSTSERGRAEKNRDFTFSLSVFNRFLSPVGPWQVKLGSH